MIQEEAADAERDDAEVAVLTFMTFMKMDPWKPALRKVEVEVEI